MISNIEYRAGLRFLPPYAEQNLPPNLHIDILLSKVIPWSLKLPLKFAALDYSLNSLSSNIVLYIVFYCKINIKILIFAQ